MATFVCINPECKNHIKLSIEDYFRKHGKNYVKFRKCVIYNLFCEKCNSKVEWLFKKKCEKSGIKPIMTVKYNGGDMKIEIK